jgi:hypothetical protein
MSKWPGLARSFRIDRNAAFNSEQIPRYQSFLECGIPVGLMPPPILRIYWSLGSAFHSTRSACTTRTYILPRDARPSSHSKFLAANVGAANAAIGDLIEELCDRAIERGRHFLASSIGVIPGAIKFDASSGRFFVAGSYHQVDFLEAARQARRGREPGPTDVQAVS